VFGQHRPCDLHEFVGDGTGHHIGVPSGQHCTHPFSEPVRALIDSLHGGSRIPKQADGANVCQRVVNRRPEMADNCWR